jgi:hypothetical protein
MNRPHLVLQYPDLQSGKIRLLATTSDKKALAVFKKAVLEEARLTLLCCDDDVLRIEYRAELHKLEQLLNTLIPDMAEVEGPGDQ